MHSRTRRILPALLLASVLPLSLSACEGNDKAGGSSTAGSSEDSKPSGSEGSGKGDGDGTGSGSGSGSGKDSHSADPGGADQSGDEGGSDVGPCDDKTHLETTMGKVTEEGDSGSVIITVTNTGSGPCVLPKVLDLSLWDEDDARLDLNVQPFNSDSEVALRPDGIASAKLDYTADPDAVPVAAGELELDGVGKVSLDAPSGELKMSDGTVQMHAFETSN